MTNPFASIYDEMRKPYFSEKSNDGNLANNYPPYDKVTRGDVIAGALGQDQRGGKKNKKIKIESWRDQLGEVFIDKENNNEKIDIRKGIKNKIEIMPTIKNEQVSGSPIKMKPGSGLGGGIPVYPKEPKSTGAKLPILQKAGYEPEGEFVDEQQFKLSDSFDPAFIEASDKAIQKIVEAMNCTCDDDDENLNNDSQTKSKKKKPKIETETETEVKEATSWKQQAAIAIAKKKKMEEDHIPIAMGRELDDEGGMIMNQLETIKRSADLLRAQIKSDEMQIPAWVQAKVTLSTENILTCANYMAGKDEETNEEIVYERSMTSGEMQKEKQLKTKYDSSGMKASMIKQYGEKGKDIYFATIRKKAMESLDPEIAKLVDESWDKKNPNKSKKNKMRLEQVTQEVLKKF